MENSQNNDSNTNRTDNADNLLNEAKQKALDALVPIMNSLDDSDPERKFDLSIKAIRYTDDKKLVNVALNAALKIDDDSARAEALVELINEINYLQQA